MDLLLPHTDRGVAVQAMVAAVVFAVGLAVVWRDRDLRVFVGGVAVMTAAWFGLRALH